jgi:hypothetical protein
MATKKIKINFKMPTPTAAERLHAQQQKNRKAAGLPDPSEYKKKLDSMKKENYEEDDGPLSQEQLDEISAQLKASYVSGAKKQIKQSLPFTKKTDEYRDIAKNFIAKRQKGIAKANEEVEQLDEYESKGGVYKHTAKYVPTDRNEVTYREPHTAGRKLNRTRTSDADRSLGVKWGRGELVKAQSKKTLMNVHKNLPEEVEQLDEIGDTSAGRKTLGNYINRSHESGDAARIQATYDKDNFAKHTKTVAKRSSGIAKAVTRLTKEQLEKKGRFVSGPVKQPYKSDTIVTAVKESFRIGGMGSRGGGRGNIYMYDRNPGPRDDDESGHVPYVPKTEHQKKLQKALTDLGNKMKQTHPKLREDLSDDIIVSKKGSNARYKIKASSYDVFKSHGFRKEEKDSQEYDYEGDMAKSDLRSIMHNAKELHDMIEDTTNLAEWCQSKITLAEDYLSTVTNYMRSEMNEEVKKNEYHIAGKHKFPTKDEHAVTVKHTESGREHVHSGKGKYLSKLIKTRYNINHYFEEVELDEMVVIKTNKPIGTRVADIGPGGKEYNVKTDKAYDDAKKKQPQGADFAAQRRKERLAKSGRMDEKKNLPGLWANIHAKRKRGEPPAKPGDKDYPKTLNIESAAEPTEGEMKGKQGYSRKAQIVMNAAGKGKKSDSPDKFQKDPELSSEIHKT